MDNIFHNMMQYIEELAPASSQPSFPPCPSKFHPNPHNSPQPTDPALLAAYHEYFQDVQADAIQFATFTSQQQIKYKVKFINRFAQQAHVVLREVSRGGSVAVFDVIQGPFKLELRMLVIDAQAPRVVKIGEGGFGNVCEVEGRRGRTVSKRFRLKKRERVVQEVGLGEFNGSSYIETHSPQDIKQAVLECSLAKICSMLGIGPQFHFTMSFDLLLFSDCIQFYMQHCLNPTQVFPSSSFQQMQQSLKKRVRAMHLMCLTHTDIKPQNVLYSPSKKQLVLCDFGISHFVKEKLGWRSLTGNQGTKEFMSDEMRLVAGHRMGWVDLYWNDVYGLRKTMNVLEACEGNKENGQKEEIVVLGEGDREEGRFVSQLERVATACYKLYRGEKIDQLPQMNQYTTSLLPYFPQLQPKSSKSAHSHLSPQPINPILLVSYASRTELPYFLEFCDPNNPIVQTLIKTLQSSPNCKLDLDSFMDANKTFQNKLPQLTTRQMKLFQRQLELFQRTKPKKIDSIENIAKIMFQVMTIYIQRPEWMEKYKVVYGRLGELYRENPGVLGVERCYANANLLREGKMRVIDEGRLRELLENKMCSEDAILLVCQQVIERFDFDQGKFKAVLGMLDYVDKSRNEIDVLVAKGSTALGKVDQAIKILSDNIKRNAYPKASFWRLKISNLLAQNLMKIDPVKALQFCQSQINSVSAKYHHFLQLLISQIYFKLGRKHQSLHLLSHLIDSIALRQGQSGFVNFLRISKCHKLMIAMEYQRCLEETTRIKEDYKPIIEYTRAYCYQALGRYWESIRIYERILEFDEKAQSPLECQVGILVSLVKEAVGRTVQDQFRVMHLENAMRRAKELYIEVNKFSCKTKYLRQLTCLRSILQCAVELKLEQQITSTLSQFSNILKSSFSDWVLDFLLYIEQLRNTAQIYPQKPLLPLLDLTHNQLLLKQSKSNRLLPNIRQALSHCYFLIKQPQKAISVFDPLFGNKRQTDNYDFMMTVYYCCKAGEYEYTMRILGLGSTPRNASAGFWRGKCYYEMGDRINCEVNLYGYLNAEDKCKRAEKENAYDMLSYLYNKHGGFERKGGEKGIPQNYKIIRDCGMYLFRKKWYYDALPWLQKSLLLQPKITPSCLLDLAFTHQSLNHLKKSLSLYKHFFLNYSFVSVKQLARFVLCCSKIGDFRIFYRVVGMESRDTLLPLSRFMKARNISPHCQILRQLLTGRPFVREYVDSWSNSKGNNKQTRKKYLMEITELKKIRLGWLRVKKRGGVTDGYVSEKLRERMEGGGGNEGGGGLKYG